MSKCGHLIRIFSNNCFLCKISCCKKCKVKCQECGILTCGKCNTNGICSNCSNGITDTSICIKCERHCIPLNEDQEYKWSVDDYAECCFNSLCNVLCSVITITSNTGSYSHIYSNDRYDLSRKYIIHTRRYYCKNCNFEFCSNTRRYKN